MQSFKIQRFCDGPMGTFGELTGDQFHAFTIEQPWRGNLQGHSCIPLGTYVCRRGTFPKHGVAFEVCDVPDRSAILIHAGNIASNFEGCIGLGDTLGVVDGQWAVLNSVVTVQKFMQHLDGVDEFELVIGWKHA